MSSVVSLYTVARRIVPFSEGMVTPMNMYDRFNDTKMYKVGLHPFTNTK